MNQTKVGCIVLTGSYKCSQPDKQTTFHSILQESQTTSIPFGNSSSFQQDRCHSSSEKWRTVGRSTANNDVQRVMWEFWKKRRGGLEKQVILLVTEGVESPPDDTDMNTEDTKREQIHQPNTRTSERTSPYPVFTQIG